MSRPKIDILAEEVLTQLEREETKALSWGFTGGTFMADQAVERTVAKPATPLLASLWEELQSEITTGDIIRNLSDRKLIFLRDGQGRTRFAETIRLLYNLKQRFSREDWQYAPNLVSNIKFDMQYRRYPKRDVSWELVASTLADFMPPGHIGSETVRTLLEGGTLKLAGFQLRSLVHLVSVLRSYRDSATIVGAGTGSGKTKAFYLPALAALEENLAGDCSMWTRILALYPRVELLKDQITECLAETEKSATVNCVRPPGIGAYYGDIPPIASYIAQENSYYRWERNQHGYECPFIRCPRCSSTLYWPLEAFEQEVRENSQAQYGQHEKLSCLSGSCGFNVNGDRLRLTRRHMKNSPPDLLFTTTEMLNRKLFDTSDQQTFGIGVKKTPFLVLLDEAHTYNGIMGAHAAYLLRRWRNQVRLYNRNSVIHYVGLSATLANPTAFFSSLTGVDEKHAVYITPTDAEMTAEGMEYNLVVRGDPVSATALLSTSVQTCMLMGRMLDPLNSDVSAGAWGEKIFAFSDKLDVLNRWHHIMRNAEEERGLYQFRHPNRIISGTLEEQKKMGQVWLAAIHIDSSCLDNALRIGITSSQSRGVDVRAKLVLATSTLEVGFNDSRVGAVIQHKAARNSASFLQRKGRGGRLRGMRPWTIVVTSAYGLDRWAYENAEQLFDPSLKETILPLRNSYVQHIQAAFALMDWISHKLRHRFRWINIWKLLTPAKAAGNQELQAEKTAVMTILEQLLSGDIGELEQFLTRSLQLGEFDLNRVLWLPPRSLMLDLIPSLYARLQKDWSQQVRGNEIISVPEHTITPLSGYIPPNLFSGLDLQGLEIEVPGQNEIHSMVLVQGMIEFAPGNASRRYSGFTRRSVAHWLTPPTGNVLRLSGEGVSAIQVDKVEVGTEEVTVFQPLRYRLQELGHEINDRSTGHLEWETVFRPGITEGWGQARKVNIEAAVDLHALFGPVRVYASQFNSGIKVTRFARGAKLETKGRRGTDKKRISFSHQEEAAALGFTHYVDAIAFPIELPELRRITEQQQWPALLSHLRPQFYLYRLKEDVALRAELSSFEIEWLWQICISSCVAISISRQIPVAEAVEQYRRSLLAVSERTLEAIFQVTMPSEQDMVDDGPRLIQRLLEHLQNDWIVEKLFGEANALTGDLANSEEFWQWLEQRYLSTVAAGLLTAAGDLLPDIDTEELLVDIQNRCIWISENVAGGIGVVSSIAATMEKRPNQFADFFWQALNDCERHRLSQAMNAVVKKSGEEDLREVFIKVRSAHTLEQQNETLLHLQRTLYRHHIAPRRELIVSLMQKLLGGNSSEETDRLALMLHEKWRWEEERLQCDIDSRVFAVASLRDNDIENAANEILSSFEVVQEKQQVILVDSLLWSDCLSSCPECLQIYNRFQSFPEPSRFLLGVIGFTGDSVVSMTNIDWKDKVLQNLRERGRVKLKLLGTQVEMGLREVIDLMLEPVEIGFEVHYPYLYRAESIGDSWQFEIRIREVLHG